MSRIQAEVICIGIGAAVVTIYFFVFAGDDAEEPVDTVDEFVVFEVDGEEADDSSNEERRAQGAEVDSEPPPVDASEEAGDHQPGEKARDGDSEQGTFTEESTPQAEERRGQAEETPSSGSPLEGSAEDAPDEEQPASLTPETIREGMQAMRPVARQCFEQTLESFPEASGRVQLSFIIEAEQDYGRVSMSEIGENSTLYESSLHDCLTDNVLDLVFEAPDDEGMVEVNYPFTFRPKPEDE